MNIAHFKKSDLSDYSSTYKIGINAIGEQLEFYLKDAFAGSFTVAGQDEKHKEHQKIFSFLGTQNNPPDIMLRGGDAFEIKKIEGLDRPLALNNSPPKDRLLASDPRITEACRAAEVGWAEKELFYAVGSVPKKQLKHLFFVQGKCYAASKEIYDGIEKPLKSEITSIIKNMGLQGAETVELGKVKKVDPLRITDFRVRGMWYIANPLKVFKYVYQVDISRNFSLVALMEKGKYESYPPEDRSLIENDPLIKIRDTQVRDPNNPAKNVEAKLITTWW